MDISRSFQLVVTAALVCVVGSLLFSMSVFVKDLEEKSEKAVAYMEDLRDRYDRALEDGYTIYIDGHEAIASDLEMISDNFQAYMCGFDDIEKTVSVTKRPLVQRYQRSGPLFVPFVPTIP